MNLPHKKKTCNNCPFTSKSMKGWLGNKRIKEILRQDSFVCHKNTKLQCAGHMTILKEKNIYYRTLQIMGLSEEFTLDSEVFSNVKQLMEHHK